MKLLLADEDFNLKVVFHLRQLGHDVITIQELGLGNAGTSDAVVLQAATRRNRCVLTFNRKLFIQLHRTVTEHAGIIICTNNTNYSRLAEKIHEAIKDKPSLENELIRIYRDSPNSRRTN